MTEGPDLLEEPPDERLRSAVRELREITAVFAAAARRTGQEFASTCKQIDHEFRQRSEQATAGYGAEVREAEARAQAARAGAEAASARVRDFAPELAAAAREREALESPTPTDSERAAAESRKGRQLAGIHRAGLVGTGLAAVVLVTVRCFGAGVSSVGEFLAVSAGSLCAAGLISGAPWLTAARRRLAAIDRASEASLAAARHRARERHAAAAAQDQELREAESRAREAERQRADSERLAAEEARWRRDAELGEGRRLREAAIAAARDERDGRLRALAADWGRRAAPLKESLLRLQAWSSSAFPEWKWVPAQARAPGPSALPGAIRFGELTVEVNSVPGPRAADEDPGLLTGGAGHAFAPGVPALLPFGARTSLLLETDETGKTVAERCLQALVLRLLTSLPAGKARFTFIDPGGLGEGFAPFMQLLDFDPALVSGRVWTEPRHIEQQLEKLTEHMETVIQKYLRGKYQSIQEYNAQAGEVAEPYRFVVVAGFPLKFTPTAAQRLVSIATAGRRCGVALLMTRDVTQPLPRDLNLAELREAVARLKWERGRFVWDDPDFRPLALRPDEPPDAALFSEILEAVGTGAKAADRVQVPFEFVAPPAEEWWAGDSRSGIFVPIGRAGATRRQSLELGRGTAQHVLVAGQTGSGKSSLLHALITNAALVYGPHELELYLLDFKKGVEFKTYAAHRLPHARVVAIESEREFGLSVLQRLDEEMKARGDRFRTHGCQDVAAFRRTAPDTPCPRALLIVDEFQEFFTEDDKLAREAALLLDRLVRQGRAFGVHVVLGSQTLGGAYTLARTTVDQMAVRIALRCRDGDARLILSDDNGAARLLTRPGEAIYNDANGMPDGNNLFQVVWLSDERRDDYLRAVSALAARRGGRRPAPIVFEGNVPADLRNNPLLGTAGPAAATGAWRAYLGDAVAIKDPTAAAFRPQGASNLLVVGQQEEAAVGLSFAVMASLALQHAAAAGGAGAPELWLLDGTAVDSPQAGVLERWAALLPGRVRLVERLRLAADLAELAREVAARTAGGGARPGPGVFLIVHALQNVRELRRQDDFAARGARDAQAPNPARDFLTVVRDGPAVGVHAVVWCDSLPSLNRALDRPALREFESRVVFQMSAGDSTALMESPAASRLGANRAYLYSEERGTAEKFRPYGPPQAGHARWLAGLTSPSRGGGGAPRPGGEDDLTETAGVGRGGLGT